MPVTPLNVYEYVRKYAEYRMLVVAEQPLHVSKTLSNLRHKAGDFLGFHIVQISYEVLKQ